MSQFNVDEKKVIVTILMAIMEADGIIHPHEVTYLDNIISSFGMNDADLDSIDEVDFRDVVSYFKRFDSIKKEQAKTIFLEMIRCDGYEDPRELDIYNLISK